MIELFALNDPSGAAGPAVPCLDSVRVRLADVEPFCDVALTRPERKADANVGALSVADLRVPGNLALRHAVLSTPLAVHVSHVVGVRADAEMRWVHAVRIVARVEHVHPPRDTSDVQLVAESMCLVNLVVCPDVSVSMLVGPTDPRPTPVALLDVLPKPLFQSASDPSPDSFTYSHAGQANGPSERDWRMN